MNALVKLSPIENGLGLYSFPDAARYIGAKSSELRRWVLGYEHASARGDKSFSPPLWKSPVASLEIDGVGFKDLLELRFVRTFREAGVPLQLIRATLDTAKNEFGTSYPLTSETFKTDGRRIFLETIKASGDVDLIDLCRRQHVIERVIGPSLRAGIEFDWNGGAARWFPLPRSKAVVFDPNRKFGQPILADSGLPTVAIASAVAAEQGDEKRVAKLYGISAAAVRNAVAFEIRPGGA